MHEAAVVSTRLAPVIAAAAERIHYAEARRANYSVMAGALIAAGIAIFTFAFGVTSMQWMRFSTVASSFSMIVVGAVVLFVFGRQTNRYPFTSATKTWKWFYRDALPDQTAFDVTLGQSWRIQKSRVQTAYAGQLPEFKEQMLKLVDDETDLDQDIQQAYVLHINEKYKNLYLSQLRSLFNSGLIFIAIVTIASGLIGNWREGASQEAEFSSFSNSAWKHRTEYRLVSSPLSDTAEWVVQITATNKSNRSISIQRLDVRDLEGWSLPVELAYSVPLPHSIAPNETVVLYATGKSSSAAWKAVASMAVEIQ